MNKFIKALIKLDSLAGKKRYVFTELCRAYFSNTRKLKILFSKKDIWEEFNRPTFKFLPHFLSYEEINPEIIAEHDLVVPMFFEDIIYLNEFRDLIKNNPIPIPSIEAANLCNDKFLFSEKLIENGFGDYIPKINGELSYPLFLKKKIDIGAVHTYFVENKEQEMALLEGKNPDDFFRQTFVSGTREYSAHILFKNNKIIRAITMEYSFEKDGSIHLKDSRLASKMVKNNSTHFELFTSILNCIGYEGICCFNYKLIENQPMIFEINPHCDGDFSIYFFSFLRSLDFN
ncbi:hypothetical protein BROC_00839 [Candidatus Brocadiaceae bacterium]|nr:hypothetical protein BROC_00839 [Candidatus Brocadiaceae bacterium]